MLVWLAIGTWRSRAMSSSEHYIEESDLSIAWAKAIRTVSAKGRTEIAPLIVAMSGFDNDGTPKESPGIRELLDRLLQSEEKQTVDTVANTIFPYRMWNPAAE